MQGNFLAESQREVLGFFVRVRGVDMAMRAAARLWRRRARRGELRGRCARCVGHGAAWLLTFWGSVWALLLATCLYDDALLWVACVPPNEAMIATRQVGG